MFRNMMSSRVQAMGQIVLVTLFIAGVMPLSSVAAPVNSQPAPVREAATLVDRPSLERPATLLSRQQRQQIIDTYYSQIIADYSDLEAFSRIVALDSQLAGDDVDGFMLDISRLALDATGNWQALVAGPWGRLKQLIHARVAWFPGYPALGRFGSTGFAADDGGNQVQHFWYSVAIAYRYGPTLAELGARYHEWNPPSYLSFLPGTGSGYGTGMDLALSRQGIQLGLALANGTLAPSQVSQWLRDNLGTQVDRDGNAQA